MLIYKENAIKNQSKQLDKDKEAVLTEKLISDVEKNENKNIRSPQEMSNQQATSSQDKPKPSAFTIESGKKQNEKSQLDETDTGEISKLLKESEVDDKKIESDKKEKEKPQTNPKDPILTATLPKKNGALSSVIAAFDVVKRLKSISVSPRPGAETATFEVIRVISMLWIILGHSYAGRAVNYSTEIVDYKNMNRLQHDWWVTIWFTAFFAVDFFFFMGGYVAIISLKNLVFELKNNNPWKWPVLYIFILIKRYARIFPVLFVLNFGYLYGMRIIEPTSINNPAVASLTEPKMTWQSWSLFYAWPFEKYDQNALVVRWFWYLVIDYQCFILVPAILMLC